MDNLTHTLFGLTLARTPIGRAGAGTTAALVLGSNAPDVDIVAALGGAASYLEWHRGITHGPLGVVGLGLASAGLVALGGRLVNRNERPSGSFAALSIAAMVGVLFHVLMDLPTSYGTRILSPFDSHWYALDWMPIVDVCLLIVLAGGLAVRHRRSITAALMLIVMLYGLRGAAHQRAMAMAPRWLEGIPTERCGGGSVVSAGLARWTGGDQPSALRTAANRCLMEIAALPRIWPYQWRLVARRSDGYQVADVSLIDPTVRTPIADVQPDEWTPTVAKAAATHAGRVFLGFSRFPAVHTSTDAEGSTIVRWEDARFLGVPLFVATVRIDKTGKIVEAGLGER
jgi:membrane-bound metal-dependent hydrolase YbcI (DUF457 family)